jgi:excisionase family DNA binding protein
MKLSLNEAAAALGKTRRQLVYLIEQGRLPAEKVGGRWYLDSAALEQDPATAQRAQIKQANLRDAIEDALLPTQRQRRYSLRDLKAFQIARPLYRKLCEHPGADHPATRHLHQCLEHLAQGCHRYTRAEKARAYQAARDAASLAALELILVEEPGPDTFPDTLEQDLMPAIAGLLRRVERRAEAAG